MTIWDYFHDHQRQVIDWVWATAWLAGLPLVIGLVIALYLV